MLLKCYLVNYRWRCVLFFFKSNSNFKTASTSFRGKITGLAYTVEHRELKPTGVIHSNAIKHYILRIQESYGDLTPMSDEI